MVRFGAVRADGFSKRINSRRGEDLEAFFRCKFAGGAGGRDEQVQTNSAPYDAMVGTALRGDHGPLGARSDRTPTTYRFG